MPGMDGTGPNGLGAMTGGGFGLCNEAGTLAQRCGARRGRRGAGRGAAMRFNCAPYVPKQTVDTSNSELNAVNEALTEELNQARKENERLAMENEKLRSGKKEGGKGK
jgi:hypothetical protein